MMDFSMKKMILILIASFAFLGCASAANKNACDAMELIDISKSYNKLVCEGIDSMSQGNYDVAISSFEQAMKQSIYEVPNFKLYPRLALAYSLNGNKDKAKENLEKAELSLLVFSRIYKCVEGDKGYFIAKESWGQEYKVDSPYREEIANRMCGAAYENMYERESLEDILIESKLVKNYLEIKRKIEGK